MRNRLTIVTAAFLLASTSLAIAQQPAGPATAPSMGSIDFGFRGTSTTGDEARWERYRDLRDGAFSRITFGKETEAYLFDAKADNIGYHDQRYLANYDHSGKIKGSFTWDSIPLNYSYISSTPWVERSKGVFTLDPAARQAVQNRASGIVGVPTTAAQLQTPSIYRGLGKPFDVQARRDSANLGATFAATKEIGVNVSFTTTTKSGHQPWGASFAFNNANELPLPLDNRTNDFSAGLEWANQQGMLRVAWDGSWFDSNIHELIWDNPLRATDTNPYDSSGYSNGNGPAQGRISLPPSNSMNVISTTGLYKMPSHTTLNGSLSFASLQQNDTLIPWTINPVIVPLMPPLPRNTAEAKVKGINALFNFTSRPNRYFGLTMRYRFNDHRNKTPMFDGTEYVRFDAVPEETGGETEQLNIKENTVDLNGTFNLMSYTALRVGYTYDDFKRTGRAFSDMTDYTARVSLDTVGNQFVTLRGIYEYTQRIGTGFSESAIEDGGAQPGLRFYDEADRDRNRSTLLFIATPIEIIDMTFSLAAGKDTYKGPGHEFGLLDNNNKSYNVGVNVNPKPQVAFGVNYGYDKYTSFQKSRNANPPADPTANPPVAASDYGSWFDPNRDWTLNNDEKVGNFNLYLDLIKAIDKTDVRVSYDYSDSNQAFVHGGSRIQELSTGRALSGPSAIIYAGFTIPAPCTPAGSTCFEPLPNVTNKWQRFTVDLKYLFTAKVGVGVGYWYEKFDVTDYATIDLPSQPGTPRIDYLGGLMTGYGNRPYKGNAGFLRVLYLF